MEFSFFTASSGPASINNNEDAEESLRHCITELNERLDYDGFIVACYSKHPLIDWLEHRIKSKNQARPVIGIMQASVSRSIQLIDRSGRFGIVTTSSDWQPLLTNAVQEMAGTRDRLAKVESTGTSLR